MTEGKVVEHPQSNNPTYKLSPRLQLEVCKLFATGFNSGYIQNWLSEEYNIDISRVALEKYRRRPKWRKKINSLVNKAERNLMKIPIAHKAHRLMILQKAINEALEWRLEKLVTYEGEVIQKIFKRNIGVISGLIKEARVELEGMAPLIDNSKHYYFDLQKVEDLRRNNDVKGLIDMFMETVNADVPSNNSGKSRI